MAFNPESPLNITYKQYSGDNAKTSVTADIQAYTIRVYATGASSWLNLINVGFRGTTANISLAVRESNANALAAGTYTSTITVRAELQEPDMLQPSTYTVGTYQVRLTVVNTVVLDVSPTTLNFQYDPSLAAPVEKLVRITSENNWDIVKSDSWITTTVNSGSNSASIYVGVDAAALATGIYQGTISVNDGTATKTVAVNLTVQAPATSTDYLYVNPQNLEFLSETNTVNNTVKSLDIDSSASFAVTSSQSWLQVDANSGVAGLTSIGVSVDSAALSAGSYFGELVFTAAGIVTSVYVSLRVVAFDVAGIVNNALYFAEDRNQLNVGSVTDNSFLVLDVLLSSVAETKVINKTQPYYRGIATAIIGVETPRFLKQFTPSNNLNSRITNHLQPLNIGINAYEKNFFTGVSAAVANYENLYFLKGRTPTVTDRACYIPQNITCTAQALIAISVISEDAPQQAFISGDISATIQGGEQDGKYLYTAWFNLAEYVLADKAEIVLNYNGKTVNVQIDNNYIERNTLAFENEWGEFEFFETKGFFTRTADVDRTETERTVGGLTKTIVLEADEDESFTLNTGYINTNAEVKWLSKILYAKQVFLWLDDDWLPVTMTTASLQVYQTRNYINSYNLQFKKAVK
ncbi:hypothetical protein SAMN05192545_2915 [Maribacter dokdonensis]|uniref:BACON domain-containing protein n=1 Tax=Maribacter dokdonensis TaxID=320912 RepID=A0ABY0UTH8_9FLAO|nr:BACON domain-containing protein [Maribacter dokdonensis]SDT16384.1 hypothetical protein SAMN05192545_2915 [Maribacter dokdonensis]